MNITLEITPQAQAELARQAAITGCGVEAHAASLLEEALHLSPPANGTTPVVPLGRSLVDVFAKARGLFAESELDFSRDASPGRPAELS
ncbi:hypothetical protein [Granulicella aggregans]|jgi:hypothetical protein|uniref:hypothetical protein n=1 Tax=Granulicella aggregans TaxID=474949 RepID=UPI0021DF75A7|nr:hypothetical protein [Granulicella aggregans]